MKNCERCGKEKSNNKSLCPTCTITVFRQRRKKCLIEYKGGKCEICGYSKCFDALDFHHKDPTTKEFGIASRGTTKSWDRDKDEVDKCILVCSNCHREIHSTMKCEYDKDLANREYTKFPIKERECPVCKVNFTPNRNNQIYCSMVCQKTTKRKVNRPKMEELKTLIEDNSWVSIGKMFGVSDNAVRKWARSYNLI